MITIYRTKGCPRCSDIQEALEELAIARRVVEVHTCNELPAELRKDFAPPLLLDEGKAIQGSSEILKYLEQMASFKELWYKHQSDACYCNDRGQPE